MSSPPSPPPAPQLDTTPQQAGELPPPPPPGLNCPAHCSTSCPTPPGSARARGSHLLQVTTSPAPLEPVDAMEGSGRAQPQCQGPAAAEDPGVQVPPGPPGGRRATTWLLSRARRSPGRGCSAQGLLRARSSSHRLEHKVSQIKAALKRRAWRQRQWLGGAAFNAELSPCTGGLRPACLSQAPAPHVPLS